MSCEVKTKYLEKNYKIPIEFYNEDFLKFKYEYSNTSLIFINCKTFDKELMQEIASVLAPMEKDTILITTAQSFSEYDSNWECIDKVRRLMSWGIANIFIHKKVK
jgi:hypothetical protein